MESGLESSASEANSSLELEERLQSMKKLLKRKERSLNRFKRALKAKDHVRNSVLRKNFENSVNGNGIGCGADSGKKEDSLVKESILKSPSLVEESLKNKDQNLSKSRVRDVNKYSNKAKTNLGTLNDSTDFSLISNDDKISKENNIDSAITQINENNFGSNKIRMPINNNVSGDHSSTNLVNDMKKIASNSTMPLLLRKRCRSDSFNKKRHVKRLFHNINNNDCSEEKSAKPNFISNSFDETNLQFSSSNLPNEEQLILVKDSDIKNNNLLNEINLEKFMETNLPCEIQCHKKPVVIIKDKCLSVSSKDKIISCCLSLPKDKSPFVLILYKGNFSIWNFKEVENANEGLLWKKFYYEENELLQDIDNRNLCLFGGGCADIIYFLIIKSPVVVGKPFQVISISFTEQEGAKLIQKSLSVLGCPDCTFHGCDLEPWSFFFCVDVCKNPSCSNSSSSYETFYTVITFDVKYSLKMKLWELDICERRRVCEDSFSSVLLLHNYNNCLSPSLEDVYILCQASSGTLRLSTMEFSFPFLQKDSCCELRNELLSAVIIYAAVVKEILFLILKSEKHVKFLAVNPLSFVFDTLYKIKLRDLDMTSKDCLYSVILYEDKFFMISSDAKVRCLVL